MRKNKSMLIKTIFYGIGVSLVVGSLVVPLGIKPDVANNTLVRSNGFDNRGIEIAKNSLVGFGFKEQPSVLSPTAVNSDLVKLFNISENGELSLKDKTNLENYLQSHDGKLDLNELGNGVKIISKKCFQDLQSLQIIIISQTVNEIGQDAFSFCWSLKKVIFSKDSKLEKIGVQAFAGCRNLDKIIIPESVTEIGLNAFYECTNLKEVAFSENSKLEKIGASAFFDCVSLTNIIIPESVKEIGSSAFWSLWSLKEVIFAKNSQLEKIGENSFYDCEKLTNITIPESVKEIGKGAFQECTDLEKVIFTKNSQIKEISDFTFKHCRNLINITIPESVEKIGAEAFSLCYNLSGIIISPSVIEIGRRAFYSCNRLEKVTFQGQDRSLILGNNVFLDAAVKFFYFENQGLFTNLKSNFRRAKIDQSKCIFITTGKLFVIDGNNILTSLTDKGKQQKELQIPNFVTRIGQFALEGSKATTIIIPDSVSRICRNAFESCENLTSIVIPSSVAEIYKDAFKSCNNLENVTFKGSELSLLGAFPNNNVKHFYFEDQNLFNELRERLGWDKCRLKDGDFVLDASSKGLVGLTETGKQKETLSIPNSATIIYKTDFAQNGNLKNVVIPKSVQEIKEQAFDGCSNLKSVTFQGSNVNHKFTLGSSAFPKSVEHFYFEGKEFFNKLKESGKLKYAGIDENKCTVTSELFEIDYENNTLTKLTEKGKQSNPLTIPESIKVIGEGAFEGSKASAVYIPTSVEKISAGAFKDCTSLATVNLGQLDKLTTIGDDAFGGCTSLTSVTIPASVTAVADNAFEPNTAIVNNTKTLFKAYVNSCGKVNVFNTSELDLTSIDGGKYVNIAENAFANLTKIEEVIIPETIKNIGANAFGGCTGLKTVRFAGNIGAESIKIDKSSFPTPSQGRMKFYFTNQDSLNNVCNQIVLANDKKEFSVDVVDVKSFFDIDDEGVLTVKNDGESLRQYLRIHDGLLDISALNNAKVINDTFRGYKELKSIILPTSLTTIGADTFMDCTGLVTVNLGQLDELTTIGASAFDRCTSLTSIVIPAKVTGIGANDFIGCTSLKEVTFMGKNRDIVLGEDVFAGDKVEKFLFEDQAFLNVLKNQSSIGIDADKCSVITSGLSDSGLSDSGLSDGAIVGITLAAIFASVCLVVGIVIPIRKRKMNALNHRDDSKLN